VLIDAVGASQRFEPGIPRRDFASQTGCVPRIDAFMERYFIHGIRETGAAPSIDFFERQRGAGDQDLLIER
jgi:hypothetical protein